MLSVNRAREALEAGKLLRFCYRHLGEKIHIVVRGVQRNRTNRSVCVCVCVSACAIDKREAFLPSFTEITFSRVMVFFLCFVVAFYFILKKIAKTKQKRKAQRQKKNI